MEKKQDKIYFKYSLGNYPVFINTDVELSKQIEAIMERLCFVKSSEADYKKAREQGPRLLEVSYASIKVQAEIEHGSYLDGYGPESLRDYGHYQLYKFRHVGMMIKSDKNPISEMGIAKKDHNRGELQTLFVRYLSWCLEDFGLIGFWGVPVDESIVLMKPIQSDFEVVFMDLKNQRVLTRDGEVAITATSSLMKLNKTIQTTTQRMDKSEMLSLLSMQVTSLNVRGLSPELKRRVVEVAQMMPAFYLAYDSFLPRQQEAA